MVGRSIHRGDVLRGDDGMPRQVWEPILDLNDWHRLCATIPSVHTRTPTDRRPPRRRAARLLSGLAVCGECGSKLYVTARSLPGGGTRPIYVCPSRRNGLPCRGLSISAEPLENYVAGEMLDLVGAWPVVRYVTVSVDDGERADIEAAIADLARQMTERGETSPRWLRGSQSYTRDATPCPRPRRRRSGGLNPDGRSPRNGTTRRRPSTLAGNCCQAMSPRCGSRRARAGGRDSTLVECRSSRTTPGDVDTE